MNCKLSGESTKFVLGNRFQVPKSAQRQKNSARSCQEATVVQFNLGYAHDCRCLKTKRQCPFGIDVRCRAFKPLKTVDTTSSQIHLDSLTLFPSFTMQALNLCKQACNWAHPENGMLPSICAVHFYTHQCNLAAPQPLKAILLKDECLHIFPNLSFIMTWTCAQVQWSWAMTAKFSPWTWTQQHCKNLTSNILWQTVPL